jgi:hypothetical protein
MPPNDRTSPADETGPVPDTNWALGADTSLPNVPAYVVLMITKYGMPRRRVYLDLGAARTAVAKAHANNQPARLVLARLEPVAADLDGGGS